MSDEASSLSVPQYRPRRPHKKSRGGCVRCKQLRRKVGHLLYDHDENFFELTAVQCDEAKPSCGRCSAGSIRCHYLAAASRTSPAATAAAAAAAAAAEPPSPRALMLAAPSPLFTSPASSSSPAAFSPSGSFSLQGDLPPLPSLAVSTLDADELDLFGHYLQHTSHTIAFAPEDAYPLRVGIPNLAFRSPAVMSSLLAASAVCECCDIVTEERAAPGSSAGGRARAAALLDLATRHHLKSLADIDLTAGDAQHSDMILANAALMVVYGAASHRVRIWLAETDDGAGDAAALLPGQSQWVTLFRAVHAAYLGLVHGADAAGPEEAGARRFLASDIAEVYHRVLNDEEMMPQLARPAKAREHVLFPLLSTTWRAAFDRLEVRVRVALMSGDDGGNGRLEACAGAFEALRGIAAQMFSGKRQLAAAECADLADFEFDFDVPGKAVSRVSPWLRRYISRVTAVTSSKPLRRIIIAFLNRAPAAFLALVQQTLDALPPGPDAGVGGGAEEQPGGEAGGLAMDVFAHWLVFMTMLDGVWWVADIGSWELGRLVAARKRARRRGAYWSGMGMGMDEEDDAWWPEDMYKVTRLVGKHAQTGYP
jgi:hypothetical protein